MKAIKLLLSGLLILTSILSFGQELNANIEKSSIKWTGKKVGGEHYGHINLKNGFVHINADKISKGSIVIDMTSITNDDLENEEYNAKLIGHLKSDDFFGVEKFPTATLHITESTKFTDGTAEVSGELTIKNITHPIKFKTSYKDKVFNATIVIDRAKYEVKYGSESFFKGLGDKIIEDEFTLDIKLVVN